MVQLNTPWIFLRGLTRGSIHWGDFPELFQKHNPNTEYQLIEIPGNGTSVSDLTPLDPKTLIDQMKQKMSLLKNSDGFNICAISLGGMVALKWAELYPDEVKSVVVINTSLAQFSPFYERLRPINYFQFIRALLSRNHKLREKLILGMTSHNHARTYLFLDKFATFSAAYPFRSINLIRQLLIASKIKIKLPLKTPVKIICSRNDLLVSANCSVALGKEFLTNVIIHPSAGHDIPLDDPEWLIMQIN